MFRHVTVRQPCTDLSCRCSGRVTGVGPGRSLWSRLADSRLYVHWSYPAVGHTLLYKIHNQFSFSCIQPLLNIHCRNILKPILQSANKTFNLNFSCVNTISFPATSTIFTSYFGDCYTKVQILKGRVKDLVGWVDAGWSVCHKATDLVCNHCVFREDVEGHSCRLIRFQCQLHVDDVTHENFVKLLYDRKYFLSFATASLHRHLEVSNGCFSLFTWTSTTPSLKTGPL